MWIKEKRHFKAIYSGCYCHFPLQMVLHISWYFPNLSAGTSPPHHIPNTNHLLSINMELIHFDLKFKTGYKQLYKYKQPTCISHTNQYSCFLDVIIVMDTQAFPSLCTPSSLPLQPPLGILTPPVWETPT